MLPGIIFCGFFIRYDELSLAFRWFTWVSPFRFTFEAATLGMYGFGREKLECSEIFCYLQKPAKILDMLDMVDGNFWFDIFGISVFIFLQHVLLYLSLRRRLR
uniref:ATP-binding cassette sub-family G member 1 n=2 Tax=Culex pipiens complex TaxID=518105 RepID=A0A8D8NVS5_CULPI